MIIDAIHAPHGWIDAGHRPQRSILVTAVTSTGVALPGARFYAPHRKGDAFAYADDLAREVGAVVRVSRATSNPTH